MSNSTLLAVSGGLKNPILSVLPEVSRFVFRKRNLPKTRGWILRFASGSIILTYYANLPIIGQTNMSSLVCILCQYIF